MEAMKAIRHAIGELFPEQGLVRTELYEEALDALDQVKHQMIDEYAKNEEKRMVW